MNSQDRQEPFTLRRLGLDDAEPYRLLRLHGLRDSPEAFGASWDDEGGKPLAWFAERLQNNLVIGGWLAGALAGMVGLHAPAGKRAHKAMLWGAYVRPEARGRGLATVLLRQLIKEAQGAYEEIYLSVVTSNEAATKLYAAAGFVRYGLERRALKIGERYYDEALMALSLREGD
jgi:RimJ/RimL family protein N-acetyltransferase